MAVAFVSSSVNAEHTSANTVFTAPTGIVDGDLLIIWQFFFSSTTHTFTAADATPPAGFNPVPGTWPQTFSPGSSFAQFAWYKIASGESGGYTVTHVARDAARGIMACVSGNDTTTPFLPNPTQGSGSNTNVTTFTGLTTTVANELILAFASDDNDTGANLTPPTGTTPTFTEQVDDHGGNYLATGVLAAAGATGSPTMTNNSGLGATAFGFFSMLAAIQPAGGGGGGGVTPIPGRVASQAVNRSLTY